MAEVHAVRFKLAQTLYDNTGAVRVLRSKLGHLTGDEDAFRPLRKKPLSGRGCGRL